MSVFKFVYMCCVIFSSLHDLYSMTWNRFRNIGHFLRESIGDQWIHNPIILFLILYHIRFTQMFKIRWPGTTTYVTYLSKRFSISAKLMFPYDERSLSGSAWLMLWYMSKGWNGLVFVTFRPWSRSSFTDKPSHSPFKKHTSMMNINNICVSLRL